MKFEVVVVL